MMSSPIKTDVSDTEFAPATASSNRFISSEVQALDWKADLPYLDESVDRPRVQMQFYSQGFMGSIERFFDKVTYEKTFTTKYGTKIHCAVIALITVCSWK